MWMKSPTAPDPASLPGPDELKVINEDVRMALLLLFASDEPLPEPRLLRGPPADIPEKPLFCVWCFGSIRPTARSAGSAELPGVSW